MADMHLGLRALWRCTCLRQYRFVTTRPSKVINSMKSVRVRRTRRGYRDPGLGRKGAGLIGLMMAVAVASLILAIAVPRTINFANNYQLQVAAEQLAGDLQRSRLDAMRLNTTVTFLRTSATTYQVGGVSVSTLYGGATFSGGDPASVQFSAFGRLVGSPALFQVLGPHGGIKQVRVSQGGITTVQ